MWYKKIIVALVACFLFLAPTSAIYWPENYGGVMLQGFYWESYTETSWTELTNQSDDIATYFDLIWVPNSGRCTNATSAIDKKNTNNMGYMPLYWWNHNSAFGTETQLTNMINTFKQKGVGIIADVVINHRNGRTCWTDFPTETDKQGTQWTWDVDVICNDDEVNTDPKAAGEKKATGNKDTGDKVAYCRDLDHTNTQLQNGIKAYTRDLLNYYGYAGFRYDMTSGYDPIYTKMYNEATQPEFSVGEYWKSNSINPKGIIAWIDSTKKTSAAFDFATKFQINYAFNSNRFDAFVTTQDDVTIPNGVKGRPEYSRYAVTFAENHDTYKDANKMNGDVVAANAYILTHPGTPCVFWVHWTKYHDQIARLIQIRKTVGITNQSTATVIECDKNHYAAKITGNNGNLIICVGDCSTFTPEGFSANDIVASNEKYKVWTKSKIPPLALSNVEEATFTIYSQGKEILIDNPNQVNICIYDINGKELCNSSESNIKFTTSTIGTYLIKSAEMTTKIIVK